MAGGRANDGDDETGPLRTCVATRTPRPVEELIRFVVGPDGQLVPDLKRRLPGRGVWVHARRPAVEEAVRRKAFGRSLKAGVVVSPTLPEDIDALLAKSAREALSMANKAGTVVSGFAKVEAAIGRGGLAAVIAATDAAPDGVRKIAQALRRRVGSATDAYPVIAVLESSELGLALGRPHVIHAALLEGPVSRAAMARLRALECYRDRTPTVADETDHMVADTTTRVPAGQGRND